MSTTLNKAVINKITKEHYDELVSAGTITPKMIQEEAWLFTDDSYVSASDKVHWYAKANLSDIPTKVSQLENDSQFISKAILESTNISTFNNDAHYITNTDIPSQLSSFNNDVGYITAAAIPTAVSAFTNDMNYVVDETDPTVPAWAKTPVKPSYTKAEVGLANVEDKSVDQIISEITAQDIETSLGYTPMDDALRGVNSGVATLNDSGKVPASQLPSYVDNVVEAYYNTSDNKFYEDSAYTIEITPEAGKIYVDMTTNKTYRWSGSSYIEISTSLILGETSATAYRGDRGKIAYDHSQLPHAPSNAEENIIEGITLDGSTILPDLNKIVNINIPRATGTVWNAYAFIRSDGVTEIGRYIDFHYDSTTGNDYDTRLLITGQHQNQVVLPKDTGTLALIRHDEVMEIGKAIDFHSDTTTGNDFDTRLIVHDHNQNTVDLPSDSGTLALVSEIPTKVSDITNDLHYITSNNNSIKNIIELTYAEYQQLVADDEVDPDTEYHILDAQSTIDHLQQTLDSLQNQLITLQSQMAVAMNNYNLSTEKTVVGTWIDNRPIYRKYLSGNDFSELNGIDLGNLDLLIDYWGTVYFRGTYQFPIGKSIPPSRNDIANGIGQATRIIVNPNKTLQVLSDDTGINNSAYWVFIVYVEKVD